MRLYVQYGDSSRTVAVSIDDPMARVCDLAAALDLNVTAILLVDGVRHAPNVLLADALLVDGSAIAELEDSASASASTEANTTWVGVVSGPKSGAVYRMGDVGTASIGRDPLNDLVIENDTVSDSHVTIRVDEDDGFVVEDLKSSNGTWRGSVSITKPTRIDFAESVRLGSSSVSARRIDATDRPMGASAAHADSAGHILVNRPPRHPVWAGHEAISLPDPLEERTNPTLTIVSLLVPLVFAAVMVVALGSWRYAIFGLLSPAMALGNWLAARRRTGRARATDATTHADSLARLKTDISNSLRNERLRRRSYAPDVLEIRRRIELPSSRLWERRHGGVDAMVARIGFGDDHWDMPTSPVEGIADDVAALVEAARLLTEVDVLVDLRNGPVGLVGDRAGATAAARSLLLQLATHQGPADLRMAVMTQQDRLTEWEWAHWLPQVCLGREATVLTGDSASILATNVLAELEGSAKGESLEPAWLFIIDDVAQVNGRSSAGRRIIEQTHRRAFAIVIADTADQLPASVATVIEIDGRDGEFTRTEPARPANVASGIIDSVSVEVAQELARGLARFEDPELVDDGAGLPLRVVAEDLYGNHLGAAAIRDRWVAHATAGSLDAPLGISAGGTLSIDLVGDGPHALVAGTTGAGKSELLRTLLVGLATSHDPDHVVFVLIDYKGGAAFDACVRLPHVVGMVTDLDDHGAERALISLEAELRYRERLLRTVGAKDIVDFHSSSREVKLPRLVVMIDEFATLRAELPSFVSSLVEIAQRGRSLGVHLVLATQRPSGAVDANIRANTNLRIALRVQDGHDSTDVIDSPRAAAIDRNTPGRAMVRRGDGDVEAVQTAFLSAPIGHAGPPIRTALIEVGRGRAPSFDEVESFGTETELARLVQSVADAAIGFDPPRRPWLEPLPACVGEDDREHFATLASSDDAPVAFLLVDDPENQQYSRSGWDPNTGHLGIWGVLGSGVSTAARSVIIALGQADLGRPVWVFGSDHSAGGLREIRVHPHIGCCLEPGERARHLRLLSYLDGELADRRSQAKGTSSDLPLIVVVIDGIAGFSETCELNPGSELAQRFERIVRDGPAVGIVMVIAGTRLAEAPRSLRSEIREHVVLEQNDGQDYSAFGIRQKDCPPFRPGRALLAPLGVVAQVVVWEAADDSLWRTRGPEPPAIDELPISIDRCALPNATITPNLHIPIGIGETSRRPVAIEVRPGEHVTISGPPGSGRTSALRLIAAQVREVAPAIVLVGIASGRAALLDETVFDAGGELADLEHVLREVEGGDRQWIVLIDDADRLELESGPLVELCRRAPNNLTLVVSIRSSIARQSFGHWTRQVRSSGVGVLLQPDNAVDGELFAMRLPRGDQLPKVPGRGYVVMGGSAEAVQLAH